jgi:hypothetical protein
MFTLVFAVAVWLLSSVTVQVMLAVPVGAPAELNTAAEPLLVTLPLDAEKT